MSTNNHYLADGRRAVQQFAAAAVAGDEVSCMGAMLRAFEAGAFLEAMTAIGRCSVAPNIKDCFLSTWANWGDSLRCEVSNDLVLIRAIRAMLPAYHGPSMHLYRGDRFSDRCRSTYGLSWTASREVAEAFAHDYRVWKGGSVLLETLAPPEAIICSLHQHMNDREEDEYLLDRRRLGSVRVIQRFTELH